MSQTTEQAVPRRDRTHFLYIAVIVAVVLGILIIGIVAFSFEMMMRWVEKHAAPWKGRV